MIVGIRCFVTGREELFEFDDPEAGNEWVEELKSTYSPETFVCLRLVA